MKFNSQKCFVMHISHARSLKEYSYSLAGDVLATTSSHPYLGVCITNNLSWNNHIQDICSKANRSLGFIRRNLYSCNQTTKLLAYRSLVRPLTEYASSVWDPYSIKNISQLETVQRRAVRFIIHDYSSRDEGFMTQKLKDLDLDELSLRRKIRRLCIFQQSRHGHLSLPIGSLLRPVRRQSRHLHQNSYTPISTRKDCYKYSFTPRTITDWNSLPEHITNITEPEAFKVALQHHLASPTKPRVSTKLSN